MKLTKEMILKTDYKINGKIEESIYILPDGTLFDGGFEYGSRCLDHRELEVFSKYNRYDGNLFWDDVMENLIMIVPEVKVIYIKPNYELTNEQTTQVRELYKKGFTIEDFI